MDHSLFTNDELKEMNDAYNVRQTWPEFILIGLDGGGKGLFQKVSGCDDVYINDMGNPEEPKYFYANINLIADAILDARKDWGKQIPLYEVTIMMKDFKSISLVREVQEKLGVNVETVSDLRKYIPGKYKVSGNYPRHRIEIILKDVDSSHFIIANPETC